MADLLSPGLTGWSDADYPGAVDPTNMWDGDTGTYIQRFTFIAVSIESAAIVTELKLHIFNAAARVNWLPASLYGSNNTTNGIDGVWTLLTDLSSLTLDSGWDSITFSNTVAYRHYKIAGTPDTTNSVGTEMQLVGSAGTPSWEMTQLIRPPSGEKLNGHFGKQVALSKDGLRMVIAHQNADGSSLTGAGVAHVLVKSGDTWSEEQKIDWHRTTGMNADGRVDSVDIDDDGNVVVIGSAVHSPGGTASGVSESWTRSGSTWSWGRTIWAPGNYELTGAQVSITGDGVNHTISVDASEPTGATNSGGLLNNINVAGGTEDAVAAGTVLPTAAHERQGRYDLEQSKNGRYLAIGVAPDAANAVDDEFRIFMCERTGSGQSWASKYEHEIRSPDRVDGYFGFNLSFDYDGNYLAACDHTYNTNEGKVYVYKIDTPGSDTPTWTLDAEITPPTNSTSAARRFGACVKMSHDARFLAVAAAGDNVGGNDNAGVIYVYESTDAGGGSKTWSLVATIENTYLNDATQNPTYFGDHNALTMDEDYNIAAGAYLAWNDGVTVEHTGAVLFFEYSEEAGGGGGPVFDPFLPSPIQSL